MRCDLTPLLGCVLEVADRSFEPVGARRGPLKYTFLHRQLSAERFFVAFDGSDSEIAARAAEADEAIPMREIALDKRFVPFLRMADIADREVEVFRPEERDHRERLSSPNIFAAATWPWRSATTQCSTRMLSPVWGSGQRAMSPAAKMSGSLVCKRELTRTPRSRVKPSRLGELKARLDADADDHNVRVDPLAPLQDNLLVFNPSDLRRRGEGAPPFGREPPKPDRRVLAQTLSRADAPPVR